MALATHGPRAYFYVLVTQLPISDLRSIVICVEVTIRSDVYMHRHCTATLYVYSASRAYQSGWCPLGSVGDC